MCLKANQRCLHYVLASSLCDILYVSSSFRCPKPPSEKPPEVGEDLWNSFLSGIFQLQSGDKIFVTLENQEIRQGSTENLMGAFMIPP